MVNPDSSGDMEDPVEQEPAVGAEPFDDVPPVTWAELAVATEGDVVTGMPEP
jgi:hypothetical protein